VQWPALSLSLSLSLYLVRFLVLKEGHGSYVVKNKAFKKAYGIRGWSKWVIKVVTNYPEFMCDDDKLSKICDIFLRLLWNVRQHVTRNS
jgi:hypothetical protein